MFSQYICTAAVSELLLEGGPTGWKCEDLTGHHRPLVEVFPSQAVVGGLAQAHQQMCRHQVMKTS